MGGREVSRPYRVGFSPKASGFYPFGDATALAGEGGVSAVVWLIQASASNHKPKGRFFWFVYARGIPKEPSLWFVAQAVAVVGILVAAHYLSDTLADHLFVGMLYEKLISIIRN